MKKTKIFVLCGIVVMIVIGTYLLKTDGLIPMVEKKVSYTKNPALKNTPLESVVKIFVDRGTNHAASGSGLLFTREGHILTNAHVVTTPLGKPVKKIEVCYNTSNNQETKCEYVARILDANEQEDLAVIKVDREIREIKPYLLVVREDDESWSKETLPLGSEIKAVGYPGVGGNSITITRGIVSGYRNGEVVFDDGSMQKIPYFIKTDTEVNHGNSGGAIFDAENRYVGIPTSIRTDEGGKISFVIFWNKINLYLNHLMFQGVLSLPKDQYVKRPSVKGEENLWVGIQSYFRQDYLSAVDILERYTKTHDTDSRAWFYLCTAYRDLKAYNKLGLCAENLRRVNPKAASNSWLFTSNYNTEQEKDNQKAYNSINKALNLDPDYIYLLSPKADLEFNLNKYEDVKKTARKMLEINEGNPHAILLLGLLSLKEQDFESALQFLGISFGISPNATVAFGLAGLYHSEFIKSGNLEALLKSLSYRVSGLILDERSAKSIPPFISFADQVATLFENDKATWGNSLKRIGGLLNKLEVNKELIDPIGGYTDQQIREYLESLSGKDSVVSQESVDGMRLFVKMTMGWIYTLMEEKTACKSEFVGIGNLSNFYSKLAKTNISRPLIRNIATRNVIFNCLCRADDYSNESMKACFKESVAASF